MLKRRIYDEEHEMFRATVRAWAEKEGTFVNHKGLAQAIHRGLRGPEGSRPDGRGSQRHLHLFQLHGSLPEHLPAGEASDEQQSAALYDDSSATTDQ